MVRVRTTTPLPIIEKWGRTESVDDYNLRIGAFVLTRMRVAWRQYMSGVGSHEEVICEACSRSARPAGMSRLRIVRGRVA
jgi:hypothetical protein